MIELKTDVLRVKNADGTWQTIPALSPEIPDVPVKGVQVAGTDLTPDENGKVNIPLGDTQSTGVIRLGTGMTNSAGKATVIFAGGSDIRNRWQGYGVIRPANFDLAIKTHLGDGKHTETWTSAEMDNACAVLGAERAKGEWVLKGTMTSTDPLTVDLTGCTEMMIHGYAECPSATSLKSNIGWICYWVFTTTYKSAYIHYADTLLGYETICAKRSTAKIADQMGDRMDEHIRVDGKHIKDITSISFDRNDVTSCEIKIYAR